MWIKICGITRTEDAAFAVEAGASAIGLNFFRGSKRYVSADLAFSLAEAARQAFSEGRSSESGTLDIVGVFVNSSVDEVVQIAKVVELTAVQFHGDESIAAISQFHRQMPSMPIVRAMRVSIDRVNLCMAELDALCESIPLAACLLDAFVPGEFGGTGATVDGGVVQRYFSSERPRLILAGGLTADNVSAIVTSSKPWGIDTASGVEESPGHKCSEKVRAFINAARGCEAQVSGRL